MNPLVEERFKTCKQVNKIKLTFITLRVFACSVVNSFFYFHDLILLGPMGLPILI